MAGRSLEEIQRMVDHCRKLTNSKAQRAFGAVRQKNGGAHYWRSPDGIMEAQTVGGVQKDAAQGQKLEEPQESRLFMNFDRGYFIPNNLDDQSF